MDEKIVKDYISRRQAVYVCLELIHERRKWLSDAGQKEISGIDAAMCAIQDLPSAQPKSYREGYQAGFNEGYQAGFKDAQSERKRGRWIYGEDNPGTGRDGWFCSECEHFEMWDYSADMKSAELNLPNYCPNCGADMRGEQDG